MSRLTFLITVITITFAGVIYASTVKSQNLKKAMVSIQAKDAFLKDILTDLEKKSGFSFVYPEEIGNLSNINLPIQTSSLFDVLKELAKQKGLKFNQENSLIAVLKAPPVQQPGRISGKITDGNGETLPGASIKVLETGQGVQTAVDGSYIISLKPGTYNLEISYISYQTQRITGIIVTQGKSTPLSVSLKTDSKGLNEVVVTSGYKKASAAGLLAKQKNASEISNGISAEQIASTPDKNLGESLKRITGVSSVDNKFILVRGIGERYNSAMLDGVVLPSTEAQSRNFSFDLIPSNLVDNIIVSKTVTPDMNASFGGGLIQINTKDIPNEDFMSFTAGASYNDQSTGKDFLSRKRGKYDFLGFDDGRRDYPKDLVTTDGATREVIDAQSKKFTNDNLTIYRNKTAPSQNYQFTIGRLLALDTVSKNKFGFTGALSYRNTQNINVIDKQNRTNWDLASTNNTGIAYGYNTTWGGLLNMGLQLGRTRFSFRNTYTRMFDNAFVRIIGFTRDINQVPNSTMPPPEIQDVDDPTFTGLLQNKLNGQHQLGKVKIEWDAARTAVNREEKDLGIATSYLRKLGNEYKYFNYPGTNSEPRITPISRHHYHNSEQHYSWNLSASIPFTLANIHNTVKTGYFGNRKKAVFDWQIAALTAGPGLPDSLNYIPIGEMIKPENIGGPAGFQYTISPFWLDAYQGESRTHAGYVMLDSRLVDKLRLVWGIRGEYYKYNEIRNGFNNIRKIFALKKDPNWQWLPSANLTYSPTQQINVRAAVSSSVVRPEMMDNSQFYRFSPYLGAQLGNQGLYSTRINSLDFKTEWFPGLGEIISIGGFYKKFDKPTELTVAMTTGGDYEYYLKSADYAKVYGMEFELRKSLGVFSDNRILTNLTVYGNLTLQKSEVRSTFAVANPIPNMPDLEISTKQKRAMYGQTPYLINAGLQYTGEYLGLNLAYNKTGYKTYIVASLANLIEYERPRQQLDAQISYRFLNKRLEVKLNAGNLLNAASTFYNNGASYEVNPDAIQDADTTDALRLKPGFSNKYEEGDPIMFRQKFGRTYSTSVTWNF